MEKDSMDPTLELLGERLDEVRKVATYEGYHRESGQRLVVKVFDSGREEANRYSVKVTDPDTGEVILTDPDLELSRAIDQIDWYRFGGD